jgi:hypothetical protein
MRCGSLRRLFFLPVHVFSPYQHLSDLTTARTSRSVPFCWSIQNRRARVPFTAYVQATHLIKLDGDNPRMDSDRSFGYRTGILGLTRLSVTRLNAPCAAAPHPLNVSSMEYSRRRLTRRYRLGDTNPVSHVIHKSSRIRRGPVKVSEILRRYSIPSNLFRDLNPDVT